jgi:phosphatidylserine decarboxylase
MIKIASEGYPFVLISLLITLVTSLLLLWSSRLGGSQITFYLLSGASLFFLVVTLFMVFFFRDPNRIIPGGEGLFVSPADGKVILIRDVHEKDYLNSETKEISIFMSPLNVHVNRAPCDGRVSVVKYSPGKFMAAYKDNASVKNENIVMVLDGEKGRVLVRQVAGFVARRAVCRARVGDVLKRGERYGIIKFSSRLDVYLPKDAQINVRLGDNVKAGETVIATESRLHAAKR